MDRKSLEARLALLKGEQKQAAKEAEQALANLQAYGGAIQECEYWLKEVINAEVSGRQAQN